MRYELNGQAVLITYVRRGQILQAVYLESEIGLNREEMQLLEVKYKGGF